MKNNSGKVVLNVVLSVIIVAVLLTLAGWLGYNAGLNAAEGLLPSSAQVEPIKNGTDVVLTPISLAENVGMQEASGIAKIEKDSGRALIDVVLPDGVALPENTVLEAWLIDAGLRGGLGVASVSENDQSYGTPFANSEFSASVDSAPFAHSLGMLMYDETRATYHLYVDIHNSAAPYDAVMITAESDTNANNYDPRPGTPVMIGEISF